MRGSPFNTQYDTHLAIVQLAEVLYALSIFTFRSADEFNVFARFIRLRYGPFIR